VHLCEVNFPEYIDSVVGFLKGIDGRAELPTVKFNRHPSLLHMHLYLRYLVYDRQIFSLHLIFVSCLESS
jgi:hypothetical protein